MFKDSQLLKYKHLVQGLWHLSQKDTYNGCSLTNAITLQQQTLFQGATLMKTQVAHKSNVNSSPPRQNGRLFADEIFEMHFREWKFLYFDSNFTEVCS